MSQSVQCAHLVTMVLDMALTSRLLSAMRSVAEHTMRDLQRSQTTQLMLSGKMLAGNIKFRTEIQSLHDVEFRVFSQFGDDGIIQWLTTHLNIPNKTFVEFGVEDYSESNTRFLLMNDNWTGLVIDGSEENISSILRSDYYWQHELTAKCAFIDRENINSLISVPSMAPEIGILSVDLDGNDYWVLESITAVSPVVLIVEYNCVFGVERPVTIPYDPSFRRASAHHSNLYWGASLRAFEQLCAKMGYAFVGCNSAGNNAYFVRREKLNGIVREISVEEGFVVSKFRDSRDAEGRLNYISGSDRLVQIRGLPVFNVETNQMEKI